MYNMGEIGWINNAWKDVAYAEWTILQVWERQTLHTLIFDDYNT